MKAYEKFNINEDYSLVIGPNNAKILHKIEQGVKNEENSNNSFSTVCNGSANIFG